MWHRRSREAAAAAAREQAAKAEQSEREAGKARKLAAELRAIDADEFARAIISDLARQGRGDR